MGFELGFEKNNFLGNGIRTPLHDPQIITNTENLQARADHLARLKKINKQEKYCQ